MGGETAEGVDLRFDRDALVEHFHRAGAVDYGASRGASGLEAGEYHMAILAPEVVLEVVGDASAGAHATAGDDDGAALDPVDRHGLLRRWRATQDRQPVLDAPGGLVRNGRMIVRVEQVLKARIDGVGADGHRAIEEHRLLRQPALLVETAEVVDQVLGTADGEGRNQYVAAVAMGLLENLGQFIQGVVAVTVVAIAIGGLQ